MPFQFPNGGRAPQRGQVNRRPFNGRGNHLPRIPRSRDRNAAASEHSNFSGLGNIMSHAGKVKNGLQMLNQVRSIISLFKK
ncbi:hypothetical protein [Bacillus sp. MUM 13]|uniref:hypothetical protein n=1 Tax=Bacillus sp. MUM 13 TaxID=1678001 RepID=UPI0008F597E4|nr:hypothetical protein [Bacillus sp. MUM 13]OIK09462.1 hypothetical protein BIV59_16935 [Bacillus sp. MUM 13]